MGCTAASLCIHSVVHTYSLFCVCVMSCDVSALCKNNSFNNQCLKELFIILRKLIGELTDTECSSSVLQGELLSPCRCDGSVRCTHQPCLIRWISERGSWSCELCYFKYQVLAISTKNPLQVP